MTAVIVIIMTIVTLIFIEFYTMCPGTILSNSCVFSYGKPRSNPVVRYSTNINSYNKKIM
jgi:hypothetical protein